LLESKLGVGGCSSVYRALDIETGARVAVKILALRMTHGGEMRARFEREARMCVALSHPNIVSSRELGRHGRRMYLVMELVEGESLSQRIAREGAIGQLDAISIARDLCDALAHAHERGLIHRDIKPSNVMLDRWQNARLVDFGLAVEPERNGERVTSRGQVIGTPEYLSPEQAFGQPLHDKTDLFSFGLVLYEMLAGTAPFPGQGIDIARKNAIETPPPIWVRNAGATVSHELHRLVFDLLQKQPEDRPTAAQAVRRLDALLSRPQRAIRLRQSEPTEKPVLIGSGMSAGALCVWLPIAAWLGLAAIGAFLGVFGAG
jgi:serine/threonine protein kinase